ncbi:lipase family protein [Nocardioides zeae]|uniref:Lipase n=1 Tax=Nocardioides zeae TaxID=1457234 RepID=A0A6P0HIM9_9ACTN|nr:lipase [Nocardioides zeae]
MIPGRVVRFASHDVRGAAVEQTGLLHLPATPPPPGGWPYAVYGHMTTGGGDRSAPSACTPEHPERRRMTQGDEVCRGLLAHGVAVLRPDYEGIGSPGPHPYLIGASLARSVLDMAAARRALDPRIGDAWVAVGHSEGAVAVLHAAARARLDHRSGHDLRGVAALTPVTRMDRTIGLASRVRVRAPGTGVVTALTGLMLRGATTVDPALEDLLLDGGLSPSARARWHHLDERCLVELAEGTSWGGLAPAAVWGPRGATARAALLARLRAEDVRHLVLPRVPVRIDLGLLDEVAPAPLTAALVRRWRADGVPVTARAWPTHHSGVLAPRHAPAAVVAWVRRVLDSAPAGRG